MKKSALILGLTSVVLLAGCSSSEPTRREQARETVEQAVEKYGFDPEYGNEAPTPDESNPIRDTERLDEVKEAVAAVRGYVASQDGDFENGLPKENPEVVWSGELERTEDDGTKIYGVYNNGNRVAEVEVTPDGTSGTIYMNNPENIKEPMPVAYVTKAEQYDAYHIDTIEGNDFVVINGRLIELDDELKQRVQSIDKDQLKQKVKQVKQTVKAKRIAG